MFHSKNEKIMKKLFKIFFIITALTIFNSCFDELLEPVPETFMSDLSVFDSKERIESQVRGIYSSFKSGSYLGGRFQVYNDIRGDDFLNLQSNGVTGYQTWSHNVDHQSTEVITLWRSIYIAINRVNLFIDGLEDNKDKILTEEILTQEEFNQYKGESLGLRAIAYHNLIQLYAQPFNKDPQAWGAILRLTGQRSSADNDMARSTLKDTYIQILQDLDDAETLLPTLTGNNKAEYITRVHKNTVIAFKTRVKLHMNDYAGVIEEGNKIVSTAAPFSSPTGVKLSLNANFQQIFTDYTTPESIISMPMSAVELPGTQNGLAHYFSVSKSGMQIGNNEYAINQESYLWTSGVFADNDARVQLVDSVTLQGNDRIFIKKYQNSPHSDWAPVMRYAEVLLNLAEAEARVNGFGDASRAVALLNAVYLRSNPSAPALSGFTTIDAFITRLMLERNMEFLGEGLKNMDIQRTLGTHRAKDNVEAVGPDNPKYVWPISQEEINTNQLVQPN